MKAKAKSKSIKKAAGRSVSTSKSMPLKAKTAKVVSRNGSSNGSKPAAKSSSRTAIKPAKIETRRTTVAVASNRSAAPERARSKHFSSAIQAYEAGIKLMHAEQFDRAIQCFESLIADHAEEPEIQASAKLLLHACEKKVQEKASRTVLRSADDHYNIAIAELNRREIASAIDHLLQALKQMPKAEHILYALATANALQGNRDQALQYLKQSFHYRPENRFLAARDTDFESLQEDADFRQLVAPAEK